jgi:hypothetical protein
MISAAKFATGLYIFDRMNVRGSCLDELDRAAAGDDHGALRHNGEMIDEASRKLAAAPVRRGAAAGLTRT